MTTHAPAQHRALARPVLARLQAGATTGETATALGLDPGLVEATVAQLVRLGLVQVAGPPRAGGACSGCPGTPGAPGAPGEARATTRLPSGCTGCPLARPSR